MSPVEQTIGWAYNHLSSSAVELLMFIQFIDVW
nr:MAG TPA: hypothetical protein [Caudoviricetes sp.]